MTPEQIDQILSATDSLKPSSGFIGNVMNSARRQASEPPPPRFPWVRIAMGLTGCVGIAASGTVLTVSFEPALAAMAAPLAPLASLAPEFCYVMAAVLVGLGVASLPRLLARS